MLYLIHGRRNLGKLLATGQLTSYGSGAGVDDGALRKGIVKAYTVLTLGQYTGNTNITINSKTDVHANACVFDHNTGLMWSRTTTKSTVIGPASNGKLPWTTTGADATAEGIFPYVAAANAASLAGYTDWRIPNDLELVNLRDMEATTAAPNAAAFPSWPTDDYVWSGTTRPSDTSVAVLVHFYLGSVSGNIGVATYYAALVRGG